MKKYMNKYSYNRKEITKKKQKVISSASKEYVVVFSLDDYEEEIIATLEKLNIDFKIIAGNIYMNAFYFKGLDNVLSSLQTNTTQNII